MTECSYCAEEETRKLLESRGSSVLQEVGVVEALRLSPKLGERVKKNYLLLYCRGSVTTDTQSTDVGLRHNTIVLRLSLLGETTLRKYLRFVETQLGYGLVTSVYFL